MQLKEPGNNPVLLSHFFMACSHSVVSFIATQSVSWTTKSKFYKSTALWKQQTNLKLKHQAQLLYCFLHTFSVAFVPSCQVPVGAQYFFLNASGDWM